MLRVIPLYVSAVSSNFFYDLRIRAALKKEDKTHSVETSYTVWPSEKFFVNSFNGEIDTQKIPANKNKDGNTAEFHVCRVSQDQEASAYVRYLIRKSAEPISDAQMNKLFLLVESFLTNSVKAGFLEQSLKGHISNTIKIDRDNNQRECICLSPNYIKYASTLPDIGKLLPKPSNWMTEMALKEFKEGYNPRFSADFEFQDGIAENRRGDSCYERLVYIDEKGNTSSYDDFESDSTLEDFVRRDSCIKQAIVQVSKNIRALNFKFD